MIHYIHVLENEQKKLIKRAELNQAKIRLAKKLYQLSYLAEMVKKITELATLQPKQAITFIDLPELKEQSRLHLKRLVIAVGKLKSELMKMH